MILDVNDPSEDVLVLLEGAARVANFSAKGREVSFSTIPEGDLFGEFAVIDGEPRSASVVALEDSRIAFVGKQNFLGLLASRSALNTFTPHLQAQERYSSGREAGGSKLPEPAPATTLALGLKQLQDTSQRPRARKQ